jgi:hypothetical protein
MESLGRTLTSDSTLEAEQLGVDLGEVAADDAAVLQAVDALVDRGGRQADRLADLGVGGPGVGLEGPDDGQVGVVERGPQRLAPSWIGTTLFGIVAVLFERLGLVRH